MKKYTLLIAFFLLCNILLPVLTTKTQANAYYTDRHQYARIITEDTPFYSDRSGRNLLFYLPYTYYVRVLNDNGVFTHVECYGTGGIAAIDGYVPSDMLFYDGLSVTNPYPQIEIAAAFTAILYSDWQMTTTLQYIFEGRTMGVYGKIPLSENSCLYYVCYNDKLGYVKEEAVEAFTIPNHPNELTFIVPEEPDLPTQPETDQPQTEPTPLPITDSGFVIKILIIICLLFAGIIGLFVALKRKPTRHAAAGYYDENDFE